MAEDCDRLGRWLSISFIGGPLRLVRLEGHESNADRFPRHRYHQYFVVRNNPAKYQEFLHETSGHSHRVLSRRAET